LRYCSTSALVRPLVSGASITWSRSGGTVGSVASTWSQSTGRRDNTYPSGRGWSKKATSRSAVRRDDAT
jgi:hypothetical protein